jgi:glutathione S-transferase
VITLYQFPISHYCEKVRWALAYKKIPYKTCNLLPGPHAKKIMSIAKTSEVPVIQHNGKTIQCSNTIIDYLDSTFTEHPLTPVDEEIKRQSLEWEQFADTEIGPNLRTYFYHTLLEYPELLIPIFAHQGPWYGKFLLKFMFPKIRIVMRKMMKINEASAEKAKTRLKSAIVKINSRLSQQEYLAGDHFSRADLAAAALLAPLIQPEKYGLPWPSPLPQPLQQTVDDWQGDIAWVSHLYAEYR